MRGNRSSHFLGAEDRAAIHRTLGWLSQAVRLNEPTARLLFSVVAVESLATHIEEEAEDDSPLVAVRSGSKTKADQRADRDACVRAIMEARLEAEPWKAVIEAYFGCTGTQSMLRAHLRAVFPSVTGEEISRLLKGGAEAEGLYKVRSQIAHGTAENVSRLEIEQMRATVENAEQFARDYIEVVLVRSLGVRPLSRNLMAATGFSFPDGIDSAPGMYHRPTDLATLYGAAGGLPPRSFVTLPPAQPG